jgi:hypothetical protein
MSIAAMVLMICVALGGSIGWQCGSFGGLIGSYLAAVVGASIGLFVGRRLQQWLDGD